MKSVIGHDIVIFRTKCQRSKSQDLIRSISYKYWRPKLLIWANLSRSSSAIANNNLLLEHNIRARHELRFSLVIVLSFASYLYCQASVFPAEIIARYFMFRFWYAVFSQAEYTALSTKLGDYVVRLLDKVRGNAELDAILNVGDDGQDNEPCRPPGKLARLQLAIDFREKKVGYKSNWRHGLLGSPVTNLVMGQTLSLPLHSFYLLPSHPSRSGNVLKCFKRFNIAVRVNFSAFMMTIKVPLIQGFMSQLHFSCHSHCYRKQLAEKALKYM